MNINKKHYLQMKQKYLNEKYGGESDIFTNIFNYFINYKYYGDNLSELVISRYSTLYSKVVKDKLYLFPELDYEFINNDVISINDFKKIVNSINSKRPLPPWK